MTDNTALNTQDTMILVSEIVSSYVSNNKVEASQLPEILQSTYATLQGLHTNDPATMAINQKPAVPVSKSIKDDYIICLEDGKELKMLKRYLRSQYDMSPDDYRRKWGLPSDYPMVAPNYAKSRSRIAKNNGLGRAGAAVSAAKPANAKKATTRGRKKKS